MKNITRGAEKTKNMKTMSRIYVLDACALIALLTDEEGADKVARIYKNAGMEGDKIIMNAVNLLEVYYDFYRAYDKKTADEMFAFVEASAVGIVTELDRAVLTEAGRMKACYKISLADSIALSQAKAADGILLTSDHHEFDAIEGKEPVKFMWIR